MKIIAIPLDKNVKNFLYPKLTFMCTVTIYTTPICIFYVPNIMRDFQSNCIRDILKMLGKFHFDFCSLFCYNNKNSQEYPKEHENPLHKGQSRCFIILEKACKTLTIL